MKLIDLKNKEFGRLKVLKYAGKSKWLCKCQCGNSKPIHAAKLKSGHTRSCGCIQREYARGRSYSHGGSGTKLYYIYRGMMYRCYAKTSPAYKNYGGRGIYISDNWLGQDGFTNFVKDMGERPEGATVERIDNNKGYSPENCRWATRLEQNSNRRDNVIHIQHGIRDTQTGWARRLGVNPSTLRLFANRNGYDKAIDYYVSKFGVKL